MIAGILVVVLWCFKYTRNQELTTNILEYWRNEVAKNLDLATLFVAIGIFAEAIGSVGFVDVLEGLLFTYGDYIGIYILFLLPLTIVLCSVIGIHPFISLVMFGKILGSSALPFSNVSLALALGVGGAISYMVSPFAGIVLTLSKFIDCRPGQIALKWNGLFSVVYLIEATLFIYFYSILVG